MMLRARQTPTRAMATVVLLAVVALVVLGQLTVWIPIAALVARTYGRPPAGTVATGWAFGIAMAVGVLVTGPAADRYGRRPVLLVGLVALAMTSLAAGAAPTWPVHLAARAAQGLAAASVPPVAITWASEALPTARRAFGVAIVITAMQAATPVGQLYGQVVAAAGGWRAVHASLAAVYLLAAVGLRRRLTDTLVTDPAAAQAERPGRITGQLLGLLGVQPLRACWLLSGLQPGALVAMYAGLQSQLPAVSSAPADLLVTVRAAGLAGILAALPLLRVLEGLAPRGQALVGVAAVGLLGQTLASNPGPLVIGSMLVAIGLPLTMSPLASMIAQFAPTARASALAVQSTVIYLGVSAGAAAAGRLGYATLCIAATLAVAVGALLLVLTVPAPAGAPAVHGGHQ